MSEMLEKVARAIHAEAMLIMVADGEVPDNWDDCGPDHEKARAEWRRLATAALRAVREPDDATFEAAKPYGLCMSALDDAWKDMIDSILSDAEGR